MRNYMPVFQGKEKRRAQPAFSFRDDPEAAAKRSQQTCAAQKKNTFIRTKPGSMRDNRAYNLEFSA